MSTKYPGGIISKTAPTPSGPYSTDTAPGVWTLEQQAYWQKLGQWPTAGNVNPNLFIENLFSTYLYTGNGSTQTITNGINLSGNGGLVWIKGRSVGYSHGLFDTVRGADYWLNSASTDASTSVSGIPANAWITGFNSNGFGIGSNGSANNNGTTYASWTFREQAKFFDVVTYTGTGSTQVIAHNLGSVPGCVITKKISSTSNWAVYHRGITSSENGAILLNSTDAWVSSSAVWNNTAPTSTNFTVGTADATNISGQTYVAYLFAHDAGGFGTSGLENVISCGSYTGNGSTAGPEINLGYEAQWVMVKNASATGDWVMMDIMRGMAVTASDAFLLANTSDAESTGSNRIAPYANGFYLKTVSTSLNASGNTYIYIAIRRGPMATPTVGTSVFSPVTYTGNGSSQSLTAGFPISLGMFKYRGGATNSFEWFDRLRGAGADLRSAYTYAELTTTTEVTSFASNTQVTVGASSDTGGTNVSGQTYVLEAFQRAPGFFDEVCFTQSDYTQAYTHNLTVVPEMMIVKRRNDTSDWSVYSAALGNTKYLKLQDTGSEFTGGVWGNTSPTSTQFTFSGAGSPNTYVAYLFATVAGVSKVGSYTGTGTTAQINCGFTTGARFVMIKRTDSTGDWYVWDSARGIVAGNDPYLLLNSTAAEVTSTDYVDTYSAGFEISSTAPSAINANGGTFIFLAIA